MQQFSKSNYRNRSEQLPPLPPPRPQSECTPRDLQLIISQMHENPSPKLPLARTSAKTIQVLPSSSGNQIVHTSAQQRNNERKSDVPANADYATCDDEVYYSSISESADDSNTASLSDNHTYLHLVATQIRQVRSGQILCQTIHVSFEYQNLIVIELILNQTE